MEWNHLPTFLICVYCNSYYLECGCLEKVIVCSILLGGWEEGWEYVILQQQHPLGGVRGRLGVCHPAAAASSWGSERKAGSMSSCSSSILLAEWEEGWEYVILQQQHPLGGVRGRLGVCHPAATASSWGSERKAGSMSSCSSSILLAEWEEGWEYVILQQQQHPLGGVRGRLGVCHPAAAASSWGSERKAGSMSSCSSELSCAGHSSLGMCNAPMSPSNLSSYASTKSPLLIWLSVGGYLAGLLASGVLTAMSVRSCFYFWCCSWAYTHCAICKQSSCSN